MLAKRIIPTLLCRGSQLVKGRAFDSWRSVGLAIQSMKIHAARSVDEIIIVDITATPAGKGPDFEAVKRLTDQVFVPVTVGGGVQSLEDVRGLLNAGADKVAIGTAAVRNPGFIRSAAQKFGNQAIVVAIDVSGRQVMVECGKAGTGKSALTLAIESEINGAGEIMLTSIDRDGMMCGYDLELIREVSEIVDIPVIAAGGCRDYEDMYRALKAGASAVAAGALFAFTDATPRGAVEYLDRKGVTVRL